MSSLDNGLRILTLFRFGRPVLRVSEVSDELGLPKSSVSRLMLSLANFGFLERAHLESGYIVGPITLALYDSYFGGRSFTPEFERVLTELASEFSFTALASTLSDIDIILVNAKYGSHPLRIVQPIGQRLPADETVTGKCLLARLDDDEIRLRYFKSGRYLRPDMFKDMEFIRTNRFFSERSQRSTGIETIGSAIVTNNGDRVGFCVIYPIAQGKNIRDRIVARILETASSVGARFGDPYWM